MRFSSLLKWTVSRLGQHGFFPAPVDKDFAFRSGKAGLDLEAYSWAHSRGTIAKCAHLHGPRAEVLNLMVYPRHALRVPIFAVELILFGSLPRVAVIDLQPAAGLEHDPDWSEQIACRLDTLPPTVRSALAPGGELPLWARSHFSRSCLYSRPGSLPQMAPVYAGYRHILRLWLQEYLPLEGPCSGQRELTEYQQHHVRETPGRKFLHTSFGVEWTERFLAEFMYTSRPSLSLAG
jgi:hypothetical protein